MNTNEFTDSIAKEAVSQFVSAISSVARPLFKTVKEEIGHFFNEKWLDYYINTYAKYSSVKTILHRSASVPFYDVFQPLFLSKEKGERQLAEEIFMKEEAIIIIGDAGSGKSMLVKHLFMQCITQHKYIPINIELRYIEKIENGLEAYIKDKISITRTASSERIMERLLEKGKFVIFLDGFDEVASKDINTIANGINDFISKYKNNKFVLTTRPYTSIELLPQFSNFSLAKFEHEDVKNFIMRQKLENEVCNKILMSIDESKNKDFTAFLTNPLLLSLYILSYRANSSVPDKKHIFYRRVVDTLFKEHDSISKMGFERDFDTNLQQDDFEKIIRTFSFLSYCRSKFVFEKDYVLRNITVIKDKNKQYKFDVNDFINDLKVSVGLWVEDGGLLTFAHRSIQEYFAALYVSYITEYKEEVYKKIWQEVLTPVRSEIHNFLTLLEEIDQYFYYKFIYLPAITKIDDYLINSDDEFSLTERYILMQIGGIIMDKKKDNDNFVMVGYKWSTILEDCRFLLNGLNDTEYQALSKHKILAELAKSEKYLKKFDGREDWLEYDINYENVRFVSESCADIGIEKTAQDFQKKISKERKRVANILHQQVESEFQLLNLDLDL